MSEPHLVSAAAALERILTNRHPEYDWIVSIGEPRGDRESAARAPIPAKQAGAVADDAGTLRDGHDIAPAGLPDDDGFEEAA